jgi:hypothetical protein
MKPTTIAIYDPKTGKLVCELKDGATLTNIPVGATVVVGTDEPASVVFELDGKLLRTEGAPPFCISGDKGSGQFLPFDGLTKGDHKLRLFVGQPVELNFKVVEAPPPPPPPPPLPSLTVMKPEAGKPRDHGLAYNKGGDLVVENLHVEGFGHNIVAQNAKSLKVNNVRTCRAWREQSKDIFAGQGLYLFNIAGQVVVTGFFARDNGWQKDKPPIDLTEYRHGVYANFGGGGNGGPVFDTCIIAGSCNTGIQLRAGGVIRNSVFLDSATAIAAVMGNFRLENCTIYDGHYHNSRVVDSSGKTVIKSWTAHTALTALWPGVLRDVWIVGRPGQGDDPGLVPNVKCFPQGAVSVSGMWGGANGHPEWKPSPVPVKLDAKDCVIAGWPGQPFTGDRKHDGSGFVVKNSTVSYDYKPVLDAVERNEISIAEAVKTLHQQIRSKVV